MNSVFLRKVVLPVATIFGLAIIAITVVAMLENLFF
jgi:hypothetical protein